MKSTYKTEFNSCTYLKFIERLNKEKDVREK